MAKMAQSKTYNTQISMDSDPLPPHSTTFSFSAVSVDAMAGPQDATRRSTQELKQDAREAEKRPAQLNIEKLPQKSQSVGRDDLGQVESEIRFKLDEMNISKDSKGLDSSYSSMSSIGSTSCSSMPSANWEEEFEQYKESMPPDIRVEYIDVLILYCEDDRPEAEKFQRHLREEIEVPNGPIKTLLYDDAEMQAICGSKIGHLEKVVQRSTYVFIFMTKNFIEDKWCEFSSESCLMEAITNPLKQWCVVPVYTEKRNTSFRVPMGLNTLKGINYYNNDRFYKNGVSRLIGDKIHVRIRLNEEHKIRQKEWLEDFKRKQAKLREDQRRVEERQKAMTKQLLDWLEMETKRLIHAGILPNYLPHSNSESDISSHESSIPHSYSSSSLKPIHAQNPAAAAYFRDLIAQQKVYKQNSRNYSPQEMGIIEQMYGGPGTPSYSPGTPIYSPTAMNLYQMQGQFGVGQGHGYFPPVSSSASYQQTNHLVKQSNSQASADMAPSAEFILHTETGDILVSVPSVLIERIKNEPEDKQQEHVKMFLEGIRQKQLQNAVDQSIPNQPVSNAVPSSSMLHSSEGNSGEVLPHFEMLHSINTGNSQQLDTCRSDNSRTSSSSLSREYQSEGQFTGHYTDGNRSNFPGEGNIPNESLLEPDGGSSFNSRGNQSMPSRPRQVYQTEKSKVKGTQSDSESDDESPRNRKKTKGKGKKVVHIHKTYIYQPGNVQIGDRNEINEQKADNENSEDEGEERVSVARDSKLPYTEDKNMQAEKQLISSNDVNQKMKKVEIEAGSETHGEMQDQPGSSGAGSSCNVDAAPSTVNKLPSSISQYETKKKQTTRDLKMEEEIEEAQEVFPDDKNKDTEFTSSKKFENSSKFDDESCENVRNEKNSQFEGSVNFNSSSSEKSCSLKRKEMPTGQCSPVIAVKPIGVARPVAAVAPFPPKDESDDNCDNTDPKTVFESQSSNSNMISRHGEDSEQTFVKVVYPESNYAASTEKKETEQLQRTFPAQVLTKSRDHDNSANSPFSRARFTDPQALFYSHNARTEGSSGRGTQEVPLGNDPLTRDTQEDPATQGFTVQSSPFKPLEEDGDDLEFDMLNESDTHESASHRNSASFEESGTKSNKAWNKKGSVNNNSKKECVIS